MQLQKFGRVALGCMLAFAALPAIAMPAAAETYMHENGTADFKTAPTRFAATNWSLTESLLALGIAPVGIPDADGYRDWVVEPPLPDDFTNLGTRTEPNFEALRDSKPDAILISSDLGMAYEKLGDIAPTLVYSIYNRSGPAFDHAEDLLRKLGALTGKSDKAEEVIANANARIASAGERITKVMGKGRKIAIVRIIDDANFRIHGDTSLFGSVLARMGLENAWKGQVNSWSFHLGGIADLAKIGDAELAYIEPVAPTVKAKLFASPLWKTLPFVRSNHVHAIPSSWTFGGVLAGARFAEQLADAIEASANP
ncbi:iron-siderophore ABC transporter substrate-binding protein [Thalassospira marina]|uniref:Ferrichrome ABC transporter substrate-binding protein n=1 Tax=Thalassospira marina TaxID=2048283 RepID=A0ABM6Q728_9PROT|nr:iron-siderophore ABC transporter substrate-binding protein [Thalassospira marina]AUG52336.1 ferrichrome ABC transporter substrate-binding protein [Thalassospira marina]